MVRTIIKGQNSYFAGVYSSYTILASYLNTCPRLLANFQMSKQDWGCLDKMSRVNLSLAESLSDKLKRSYETSSMKHNLDTGYRSNQSITKQFFKSNHY